MGVKRNERFKLYEKEIDEAAKEIKDIIDIAFSTIKEIGKENVEMANKIDEMTKEIERIRHGKN